MDITPTWRSMAPARRRSRIYAATLGGTLQTLMRYRQMPVAANVPAGFADKIVHATLSVSGRRR